MEVMRYCLGCTDAGIADDVVRHHGQSTIMGKTITAKKNGSCECENKNPKRI